MKDNKSKLVNYFLHKNNASYIFLWVSCGLVFLASIILFSLKTEENVQIRGEVAPKEGIFQIKSPSTSIVEKILVYDGDFVRKKQILFTFKKEFINKEIKDALKLAEISKKNRKDFNSHCKEKNALLLGKESASSQIYESDKKSYEMMKQLLETGSISQLQVLQAYTTMMASKKEYLDLQSDLVQLKEQCNSGKLEKEKELSQINIRIESLKHESNLLEVKSPIDGYIYDIAPIAIGGVIQEQERIANIASDLDLIVKAIGSGKDITYLKTGTDVKIRVDSFPYTEYGVLTGTIINVAPQRRLSPNKDAMITDINSSRKQGSSEYTLTINIDKTFYTKHGKKEKLKPGMEATILVTLRQRPIIEYFTDIFKNFYDPLKTVR